jgi:hypothetical protein
MEIRLDVKFVNGPVASFGLSLKTIIGAMAPPVTGKIKDFKNLSGDTIRQSQLRCEVMSIA